jgi:hypothetical protein
LGSAQVNPSNVGRFIGGITEGDVVVYFLDKRIQTIHVFHTSPTDEDISRADVSRMLPRVSGEYYFGGIATTGSSPATNTYVFQLFVSATSTESRVETYYASDCQACSACASGHYAKFSCNTLYNYDTSGCTTCRSCSPGQYKSAGSCTDTQNTVCISCLYHYPCFSTGCLSDAYTECGDGERVDAQCSGLDDHDTSSCQSCPTTGCGYNQYRGRNCACLLCETRGCVPGEYLDACSGEGDTDTSSCKECTYYVAEITSSVPSRYCPVNEFMSSECLTGSDSSDVSECKACNVQTACPYNQLTILCPFKATSDTSKCIACDRLDSGNYFHQAGCKSAVCESGDNLVCNPSQTQVHLPGLYVSGLGNCDQVLFFSKCKLIKI